MSMSVIFFVHSFVLSVCLSFLSVISISLQKSHHIVSQISHKGAVAQLGGDFAICFVGGSNMTLGRAKTASMLKNIENLQNLETVRFSLKKC